MSAYKFDRRAFQMMTFRGFDASSIFGKEVPYAERLRQAYFLISKAYGFTMADQPYHLLSNKSAFFNFLAPDQTQ